MVVGIHNLEGNWRITPPNDQYAQVTLGDVTSGGGGPMVRMTRTALIQNGYLLFIFIDTPGSSGIYRIEPVLNSFTFLTAVPTTPAPAVGDVWKLTAIGNTLTAYKNGVQVAQTTDATYASGDVGIEGFGSVFGFSAWEGGNLAGPPPIKGRSTFTAVKAAGGPLSASGDANGVVTVADATPYVLGAYMYLSATGLPTITCKIISLPAAGKIGLRKVKDPQATDQPFPYPMRAPNYGGSDVSAYTTVAGATCYQPAQVVFGDGSSEPVITG